jgi:hypothetical protein
VLFPAPHRRFRPAAGAQRYHEAHVGSVMGLIRQGDANGS